MICKNCGVKEAEGPKATCSEECRKAWRKKAREGYARRMQDPVYREKKNKKARERRAPDSSMDLE